MNLSQKILNFGTDMSKPILIVCVQRDQYACYVYCRDIVQPRSLEVGRAKCDQLDCMFVDAIFVKRTLCGDTWTHLKASKHGMFEGSYGSIADNVCASTYTGCFDTSDIT